MKRNAIVFAIIFLIWCGMSCEWLDAGIFLINSPADFTGQPTTINFEGFQNLTVANNLYQNQGITFSRDDGNNVVISDWAASGRSTSSGSNSLATIGTTQDNFAYVSSLNVHSATPLYELGAYFGNDQTVFGTADFTTEQLSAYSSSGVLLGSVTVTANQNTSIDQFIGIGSDTPIASVRFENFSSSGTPSQFFAVEIDDLTFVPVPEPSLTLQIGCSLIVFLLVFKARSTNYGKARRSSNAAA